MRFDEMRWMVRSRAHGLPGFEIIGIEGMVRKTARATG